MHNSAYKSVKKTIDEIVGIPLHDLPEMRTWQEMINHSSKYNWQYFQGIEIAEQILIQTREDLSMLKSFYNQGWDVKYLVASLWIVSQVMNVIEPIIDDLTFRSQQHPLTWSECFDIETSLLRVRKVADAIKYMEKLSDLPDRYLAILKRFHPIEIELDRYLKRRCNACVICL